MRFVFLLTRPLEVLAFIGSWLLTLVLCLSLGYWNEIAASVEITTGAEQTGR